MPGAFQAGADERGAPRHLVVQARGWPTSRKKARMRALSRAAGNLALAKLGPRLGKPPRLLHCMRLY